MGRSKRRDRIQIRCEEDTRKAWDMFAAGFDNPEKALQVLLEAYSANEHQAQTAVTFDVDFRRRR